MATSNPAQQIADEINALQSRVSQLQDGVRLSKVRDAVEDLQTNLHGMNQRVTNLRQGGYAFEKELEAQAADFARQWGSLYPSITTQINSQSATLQAAIRPLEAQLTQLATLASNPNAARPVLTKASAAAKQLEDQASAAERMIDGMYNTLRTQAVEVNSHLTELEAMLKNLAEASFKLLSTESGIMAVKAVWYQGDKEKPDDPDGILYLTDQRLIFEQKEEIATKKVLFIATEKKKVQELKWEVPVTLVENITTSKQGMLKNEDHLHLNLASGAPYPRVNLHIWQPCDSWVRLINRAKTRDFDSGRAIAIDQAEAQKAKAAPSQCPNCGGNITQVVMRGMDTITCEYCGFVIRL